MNNRRVFIPLVLLVLTSLPREFGKAKASRSFKELFAKSRAANRCYFPPSSNNSTQLSGGRPNHVDLVPFRRSTKPCSDSDRTSLSVHNSLAA